MWQDSVQFYPDDIVKTMEKLDARLTDIQRWILKKLEKRPKRP